MQSVYNGFYTITSPTGEHRTFQIKTQAADAHFMPGKRIVAMLVGSNNETDYQGFGVVSETGIAVFKKKRGTDEPSFWEKSARLLWDLSTRGEESAFAKKGFTMLLDKRCIRCNRRLTNPTSIESGIGPECAERM